MNNWTRLPTEDIIQKTAEALIKNNFSVDVVATGTQAREKVLALLPKGTDVLANTSITLETIGITDAIDNSSEYESVRKHIFSLDHKKDADKIRTLRNNPTIALGSVHAVTQTGQLMIASNTGSQLGSEVFGAKQVIFVIGAQKIVQDSIEGEKRIFEHSLPLETIRSRKAYHLPDTYESYPSKILLYNRETHANRVHIILVKEVLGY